MHKQRWFCWWRPTWAMMRADGERINVADGSMVQTAVWQPAPET
jgi:hypothetical protein